MNNLQKELINKAKELRKEEIEIDNQIEDYEEKISKLKKLRFKKSNEFHKTMNTIRDIEFNAVKKPILQKQKKVRDEYEWNNTHHFIYNIKVNGKKLNVYKIFMNGKLNETEYYIVNKKAFLNTFEKFPSNIKRLSERISKYYPYEYVRDTFYDEEEVIKAIKRLDYKYNQVRFNVVTNEFEVNNFRIKFENVEVV